MYIRYGSRDRNLRADSHLPTLRFDFFFKFGLCLFVFLFSVTVLRYNCYPVTNLLLLPPLLLVEVQIVLAAHF